MSTPAPHSEPEIRAERESLSEMFKSLSTNVSTLVQQEIELAKAELNQSVQQTKKSATVMGAGAGMLGGAGIAGHFVLLFLSLALMWALSSLMSLGWAAFIVAILWAIVAGVLAVMGKNKVKRGKVKLQQATSNPLPHTRETIAEIPETVNPSKETR